MRWLLLCLALLSAGCSETPQRIALPAGSVVLALGDSLTAGAGVQAEQAWPALLSARTGWRVVNGGVSGDTSAEALRRLPALLNEHQPVLVLVTLGGNDMLRHVPPQQTVANLEQVLQLIEQQNAQGVLLATPQPSVAGALFRTLSPPDFYRQLAEQRHIPLIEEAISEVLSDPQLKGDPLHPNVQGHVLLAEKIYAGLQEIGYVR